MSYNKINLTEPAHFTAQRQRLRPRSNSIANSPNVFVHVHLGGFQGVAPAFTLNGRRVTPLSLGRRYPQRGGTLPRCPLDQLRRFGQNRIKMN